MSTKEKMAATPQAASLAAPMSVPAEADGQHGITANTPKNILLGAGAYYKGLKWSSSKWDGTVIGATNGGGKVTIKPEIKPLEVDGAYVPVKGMHAKFGGTATMEVNFAEVSPDVLTMGSLFKKGESSAVGYDMLVDKPKIEENDYIKDFGFVGLTAEGAPIIIIFDYALCTSGLETEPKPKDQAVQKLTLEAVAAPGSDLRCIPVKIYYPTVA